MEDYVLNNRHKHPIHIVLRGLDLHVELNLQLRLGIIQIIRKEIDNNKKVAEGHFSQRFCTTSSRLTSGSHSPNSYSWADPGQECVRHGVTHYQRPRSEVNSNTFQLAIAQLAVTLSHQTCSWYS